MIRTFFSRGVWLQKGAYYNWWNIAGLFLASHGRLKQLLSVIMPIIINKLQRSHNPKPFLGMRDRVDPPFQAECSNLGRLVVLLISLIRQFSQSCTNSILLRI